VIFVKDEALQSWIYRNLYSYGHADFSSVIGKNGLWHKKPFFPKEINVSHRRIPDKELIEFLRLSGVCQSETDTFNNPVKYIDEVNIIFPADSRPQGGNGKISIGYCSSCIKESIKNLGFGYFKADWLYGKRCEIHNSALEVIISNSRAKTINQLRFVLEGSHNVSGINCNKTVKFLSEEKSVIPNFYIMPCILNEFFNSASSINSSYFSGLHYLDFYERSGRKKVFVKNEIQYHFTMYQKMYGKEFLNFLEERATFLDYKYGYNQKDSLVVKLMKSKKINCSKCSNWASTDYCPIKPIILVPLEEELMVLNSKPKNPCDSATSYNYI